jgi:hypothetical protein
MTSNLVTDPNCITTSVPELASDQRASQFSEPELAVLVAETLQNLLYNRTLERDVWGRCGVFT